MTEAITPFTVEIEEAVLDDLRQRLRHMRRPEQECVGDRSQGGDWGSAVTTAIGLTDEEQAALASMQHYMD